MFLSGYEIEYKPLSALVVLVLTLNIQECVRPYRKAVFNSIEYREITASLATIYGGLMFLEQTSAFVTITVFVCIIATNVWFYLLWAQVAFSIKQENRLFALISTYLGRVSCYRGDSREEEEEKEYPSNS